MFKNVLILISALCKCTKQDFLPEQHLAVPELIRYFGYPAEVHRVRTDDGYILTMHRIPYGRNDSRSKQFQKRQQPILLQHGLASNSVDWVLNMPHQCLGFIMADNGYDVWMGNIRGNSYSQLHVNMTKKDKKYWDFSWQQMAEFDLPAMVNYILNKTGNSQLVYVGHSQGTLIGFAKFSTDLLFAKKIKRFIALAPVSTVGHITSPVRHLAPFAWMIQKALDLFGDYSLGKIDWMLKYMKPACQYFPVKEMLCENLIFFITGFQSKTMINETRLPVFLNQNPDDTSTKNLVHFAQMIQSGQMHKYDYGYWNNWQIYGQFKPPTYPVENMQVDTVAFWSTKDALADTDDVSKLLPRIKHLKSYRFDDYSHLDFIWAINAREKLYSTILHLLAS